jgi:hypothetical protein
LFCCVTCPLRNRAIRQVQGASPLRPGLAERGGGRGGNKTPLTASVNPTQTERPSQPAPPARTRWSACHGRAADSGGMTLTLEGWRGRGRPRGRRALAGEAPARHSLSASGACHDKGASPSTSPTTTRGCSRSVQAAQLGRAGQTTIQGQQPPGPPTEQHHKQNPVKDTTKPNRVCGANPHTWHRIGQPPATPPMNAQEKALSAIQCPRNTCQAPPNLFAPDLAHTSNCSPYHTCHSRAAPA